VVRTVLLLILSNTFMTAAWYGHLRFKSAPIWLAIIASWLIALPEYGLQVPANRLGYGATGAGLSAYELKIIQECVTLASFALILAAVGVAFWK